MFSARAGSASSMSGVILAPGGTRVAFVIVYGARNRRFSHAEHTPAIALPPVRVPYAGARTGFVVARRAGASRADNPSQGMGAHGCAPGQTTPLRGTAQRTRR